MNYCPFSTSHLTTQTIVGTYLKVSIFSWFSSFIFAHACAWCIFKKNFSFINYCFCLFVYGQEVLPCIVCSLNIPNMPIEKYVEIIQSFLSSNIIERRKLWFSILLNKVSTYLISFIIGTYKHIPMGVSALLKNSWYFN